MIIGIKSVSDSLYEELGAIRRKPTDDGSFAIESKESVKERLGRSPDYADAMMMRCLLDLTTKSLEWIE
jgi:hypothetical protein